MRRFIRFLKQFFISIGGYLFVVFERIYDFLELVVLTIVASVRPPWQFSSTLEQFNLLIVKSAPLVLITSLSTGAVLALQFGHGMARFGGKFYVPTVVSVSIVRALGPVFTCLMIASRVGSGIAAELGSMKVSQQVDAIRALGTDPIRKLVSPRIVALFFGAPMLTVIADISGILGGLFVSTQELGIAPSLYIQKSYEAIQMSDIFVGLGKTTLFAVMIGFIGCFNGLRTSLGTAGIGIATTKAVVTGSIFVMLGDVIFTKLTWMLGW